MVAPSFQNMTKITEPYIKAGKMYIDVKNEKTGTIRSVRWYNEIEYHRQYGKAGETSAYTQELATALKTARGFLNGPITLIRGTRPSDEPWLASVKACYAIDTGWYFRSTDSQPEDLSSRFKLMKLSWEEFTSDGVHKHSNEEVINIIKQKEKRAEYC